MMETGTGSLINEFREIYTAQIKGLKRGIELVEDCMHNTNLLVRSLFAFQSH